MGRPSLYSLALKWAKVEGPCEQWGSQLKEAELLDVLKCIQKSHTEKGKRTCGFGKARMDFVNSISNKTPTKGAVVEML